MKRKGTVNQIDVRDRFFGPLKDQARMFVGQIENYDRFILYYGSSKEMMNGAEPRGSFSLEDLKSARFSWMYKEIGIISDKTNTSSPIMKKLSKIPQDFFTAIIVCIRFAIGSQTRKTESAATVVAGAKPKRKI